MGNFVARQPIFSNKLDTFGYELLFRKGDGSPFDVSDGDRASMSVMDNSFFTSGIHNMVLGKKAFLNCTRFLLLNGFVELLPKDKIVVEILETVEPDKKIIDACYNLKAMGYTLALDDFQYSPKYDPLIALADMIKVDISISPPDERKRMADMFLPMGIEMLAERVETRADLSDTKKMGYTYFQGYFFSKPVIIKSGQPPETKVAKLRLLQEVAKPDFDMTKGEAIMKHDPTLSMKLFKYINSSFFGVRNEIKSIKQALAMLGSRNLRKWLAMLLLGGIGDDKPSELMTEAVMRGKFCEHLAGISTSFRNQEQEFFMVGMFSLLDAFMDQPMEVIIKDMPLPAEVTEALMGGQTACGKGLALYKAYGAGDWNEVSLLASMLQVDEARLPAIQEEAIRWAHEVISA